MHIVLVEDDEVISETTQLGLERLGYTVTTFADGRDGYEFVARHGADVVLLDLMLPTMNGASIARAIRETSTVPIIIISARSDNLDVIQALEAGADDYLTKPFDLQVLNARIRAVVRRFIAAGTGRLGFTPEPQVPSWERASGTAPAARSQTPGVMGASAMILDDELPEMLGTTPGHVEAPQYRQSLAEAASIPPRPDAAPVTGTLPVTGAASGTIPAQFSSSGSAPRPGPGGQPTGASAPDASEAPLGPYKTRLGSLMLDTSRLTVLVEGKEVHLTPTELRVLLLLTEEPGRVYSREKIAMTVWGFEWAGDSRVVDVHIQRLRKKIGAHMIETQRGYGYRFAG